MSEKRRLRRIENSFGTDLNCCLVLGEKEYSYSIEDFNSFGVRIDCQNESNLRRILDSGVSEVKLNYGTKNLGVFNVDVVMRSATNTNHLVLLPNKSTSTEFKNRASRASIPEVLQPFLSGHDPIRIHEILFMRIVDISESGFLAKSSLSNRHLFPGQVVSNYTLYLPLIGAAKVSFRIANIRDGGDHLHIGCEFINADKSIKKKLNSFLLFCFCSSGNHEAIPENPLADAKLASLLRVKRIDSHVDFENVLKVRFSAYNGAQKLKEDATEADMHDEFDKNSIILGAYIGPKLIGTIRIVFSENNSRLPFEKFFNFPKHIKGLEPSTCIEISKLAILPEYQGSEVLFRLFQSFAIEFIPKRRFGLLMATHSLAKNYVMIGAEKISPPVDHPVVPGEKLCLYLLDTEKLKTGRMSALAWLFFARETIDYLSKFGFSKKTVFPILKYLRAPFEISQKFFNKALKSRKRARPKSY